MSIKDFSWDDDPETKQKHDNFEFDFSKTAKPLEAEEEEEEEQEEEEEPEGKKSSGKKAKEEEEEEDEDDFQFTFEDESEEEEEDEEEEEGDKKPAKKATTSSKKEPASAKLNSKSVLSFLHTKGLTEFGDEVKVDDLSDDEAEDQLEDILQISNEKYMEEQVSNLPDIAKNVMKIAAKGGDVNAYLATVAKSAASGITEDMDLTTVSNQEKIVRAALASEGKDAEEIQEEIDYLKEKDKLEATATKKFEKWKKSKKENEDRVVAEQENAAKKQKESSRKYRDELSTALSKAKEISSFSITVADKRDLPAYIANPAYDTPSGGVISEFQKDIFEVMKDKEKVIVLAKILKSNFDFSQIVQKGASKATKDIKDTIQSKKDSGEKNTRVRSSNRSWMDYLG